MAGKSTGRNVKPSALKVAQGTARADRMNQNEPEFAIVKDLKKPPLELQNSANEVYLNTGVELINQGLLTKASFDQFLHYCEVTGIVSDSYKDISDNGIVIKTTKITEKANGDVITETDYIPNPNIKIHATYVNLSRQLANEFGLTPASSSKVSVPNKPKSKLDDYI
jgi:P27 family predicted phage terminase small subunit